MKNLTKLLTFFFILLFIGGCASEDSSKSQPDYDSTKEMMVDMLKTDDGKAAVQEVLGDEKVKQQVIMDQAFVKETIQQTLTSEKGKKFWQETMKDPEFAKTFAESMQKENERILKNLMKDPEYQGMLMNVLKDPEMEKATLELLKSKEYRQQVMNTMSEAFESPYFVAKVNEILTKVAKEQMEKKPKEEGGGGGE